MSEQEQPNAPANNNKVADDKPLTKKQKHDNMYKVNL